MSTERVESGEGAAPESPKRNTVRKYGRARVAEDAGEGAEAAQASTSATRSSAPVPEPEPQPEPPIQEKNTLSSEDEDGDRNEDASYADLRKELGLGGWNAEVDAIDDMPEDQLRTLPSNLLDEQSEDEARDENVGRVLTIANVELKAIGSIKIMI